MNADKTTIKGNLNITDTKNGLTVYETTTADNKNVLIPRINLQPKQIEDITAMASDTYDFYNKSISQSNNNSWSLDYSYKQLTCKKDDTVTIDKPSLRELRQNSSGTLNPPYESTVKLTVKMQKVVGSTVTEISQQQLSLSRQDNYGTYRGDGYVRFTIPEDGTYRFQFNSVFT